MEEKTYLKKFFAVFEKVGRLIGRYLFSQPHEYEDIPGKPQTILRKVFKGPRTLHWGINCEGSIPLIFIRLEFGYDSQKEHSTSIDVSFGYRDDGLGWTTHWVRLEECPEEQKTAVSQITKGFSEGKISEDEAFLLITNLGAYFVKGK